MAVLELQSNGGVGQTHKMTRGRLAALEMAPIPLAKSLGMHPLTSPFLEGGREHGTRPKFGLTEQSLRCNLEPRACSRQPLFAMHMICARRGGKEADAGL